MPLHLSWEEIATRLALTCVAGFLIGLNRDEQGHPAGTRTTMLVCLAAALAMLQVNILLPTEGKTPSSFIGMDVMRLPLGILSGIGFIGAGVIIKQGSKVSGVTTAATIWLVTVLGLLFGAGNIALGVAGSVLTLVILWAVKWIERLLPHQYRGLLHLVLTPEAPNVAELRQRLTSESCTIHRWRASYEGNLPVTIDCELKWSTRAQRSPELPSFVEQFRRIPGIRSFVWKE